MADIPRERVIEEISTLKALADPVRMTLLDVTMAQPERTWTARELAAIVGVLPTNIYYHLNMLERNALLQVRDTRVVNGIIEKHYGAGQHGVVFQRRIGEGGDGQREVVSTLISRVRDDLDTGLAKGTMKMSRDAPDYERALLSQAYVEIPEDRVAEFREELKAVVARYEGKGKGKPGLKFTVLAIMYPREV
jgi:hypothetical protein